MLHRHDRQVIPSLIAEKVVAGTLKMCHGVSNIMVRVSNSIGVKNFVVKHILSIVYFTTLMDKPMLDQKILLVDILVVVVVVAITGALMGRQPAWWWRRRCQGVGGAVPTACGGAAGCSGGGVLLVGCGRVFGFGHSNYCTLIIILCLLCRKKCSTKVLRVPSCSREPFFCSREHFFAPGSRFLLRSAFFSLDNG